VTLDLMVGRPCSKDDMKTDSHVYFE
jgi:hypothetical protein